MQVALRNAKAGEGWELGRQGLGAVSGRTLVRDGNVGELIYVSRSRGREKSHDVPIF
jgi:hypothetical protein